MERKYPGPCLSSGRISLCKENATSKIAAKGSIVHGLGGHINVLQQEKNIWKITKWNFDVVNLERHLLFI